MALTKVTSAVIKDATITDADIGSTLTTAITGSFTSVSSSIATRFDSRESDMTLATASISAITASISRLNDEISTDDTDMTLATASIAAITASIADNLDQAVKQASAVTFATVDTGQGANELYDMDQNVKTDSDVTFGDINSTGTITAVEIHTTFVSSSIAVISGSNNFGDATDDHHSFTGSLSVSGSGTVTGSFTVEGPSTIDELTATSLTATGNVSSSITSTGSFGSVVAGGTGVSTFTGGNVGIGTTAPDAPLHVSASSGTVAHIYGGSSPTILFEADGGDPNFIFKQGGSNRFLIGYEDSADGFRFDSYTGSWATRLFVSSSGEVGIGTTAPDSTSQLHIQSAFGELRIEGTNDASSAEVAHLILEASTDRRAGITIEGDSNDIQAFMGRPYDSANTLAFETDATERMRITSAGNVGIRTATPTHLLNLVTDTDDTNLVLDAHHDNASAHPNLMLRRSRGTEASPTALVDNNLVGEIEWQAYDGNSYGISAKISCEVDGGVSDGDTPGALVFLTTPDDAELSLERMRITADGDVTAVTGDLIFGAAGKGVCLGVTSNTDANTLDDYEEGTWSPSSTTISGASGTFSINTDTDTLSYTKIGRMVFLKGALKVLSQTASAGRFNILGLPFTAGAGTESSGQNLLQCQIISGTGSQASGFITALAAGSTTMTVKTYSGVGQSNDSAVTLQTDTLIYISGYYSV